MFKKNELFKFNFVGYYWVICMGKILIITWGSNVMIQLKLL